MQDKRLLRIPRLLTCCAIICLLLGSSGSAQICGDTNCDGFLDIADMSDFMSCFINSTPPAAPCYDNYEYDGHANVNISDFLTFISCGVIQIPEFPCGGCFLGLPPVAPAPLSGNEIAITPSTYPSDFGGPLEVQLRMRFTGQLYAFAIPFRVMIGAQEATIVAGSLHAHAMPDLSYLPIRVSTNNILLQGADHNGQAAGTFLVLDFQVIGPFFPGPNPAPLTLELVPFPVDLNPHTGDPVHSPLLIFSDNGNRSYVLPVIVSQIPCCQGLTGNVDCDAGETTDISDLSAIIDNLYISFAPLCCKAEANCDGSLDGKIDISDLTVLIDYLYISFTPTVGCL